MSSCTPMRVWVYSRGLPFIPIPPDIGFNFSVDESDCGWIPGRISRYFPGFKVGQIYVYSSFLTIWWRWFKLLRITNFIPGPGSWMKLFSLVFVFLSQGSLFYFITCRTTADQACFCTSQLISLWGKQSNSEIFELWNTWRKVQLDHLFFHQEVLAATLALTGLCITITFLVDVYLPFCFGENKCPMNKNRTNYLPFPLKFPSPNFRVDVLRGCWTQNL
jgi:hypothetical protein